jgi:hypothetical protein
MLTDKELRLHYFANGMEDIVETWDRGYANFSAGYRAGRSGKKKKKPLGRSK